MAGRIASHPTVPPPSPRAVLLFKEHGTLKVFPEKVKLRPGQGICWAPVGGVGNFKVEFKKGSPFNIHSFDRKTMWSGHVRPAAQGPYRCSITSGGRTAKLSAQLQIDVPSKQVARRKGARLQKQTMPQKVQVTLERGKIVVTPPTVIVRSGVSTVEWHGERDHEVKVKFVRESPFGLRNDAISGAPAKSKKTRLDAKPWPHVYKYKIQYRGRKLDPDVVVDPPPGGTP